MADKEKKQKVIRLRACLCGPVFFSFLNLTPLFRPCSAHVRASMTGQDHHSLAAQGAEAGCGVGAKDVGGAEKRTDRDLQQERERAVV
jgi:hypothetical protein